jgi:hypothetical protein
MARRILDDEPREADTAAQDTDGASGWEDHPNGSTEATPIGFAAHKGRHTFRDGFCIKCGKAESEVSEGSAKSSSLTRGRSSNNLTIEMLASALWLGAGIGIENIPEQTPFIGIIAKPVERPDGSEGVAPTKATGRMLQLEASIAGRRIDKAIKGTIVAKFLNALLNASGPWAEIVPLLLPPLIMGVAAAYPAVIERFPALKALMVATMVPVLTEAAKLAEQQSELMGVLNQANEQTIAQAINEIQNIMKPE